MFNPHKAGLDGVDKDRVNKIIEESSRGTPFWENQQRKNARHQERIKKLLEKIETASNHEWSEAQTKADDYLEQLELNVQQVVVHIDMDAFFASVEERDDPTLRERPMAVGDHSMISTSNYVARRFGVRAGLPGFIALKLCPQLVLVRPDMGKYSEASAKVMQVLSRYDPNLVQFGLDEAALDITELCRNPEKTPDQIVAEIRQDVRDTTGLTCSAGIGPNQMVAKMLADVNKPNGQFRLTTPAEIESFIENLTVRKIFGVGQVQEKMLAALGCVNCSDLIDQRAKLFLGFSDATAKSFLAAAKGICDGLVNDSEISSRTRRSKSAETTFKDSDNVEFLTEVCHHLSERLSEDLAISDLQGKLITVKFKTSSFDVFSRSVALELPTRSLKTISTQATRVLKSMLARNPGTKLRLLGVRMSSFQEADGKQATLSQLFKSTAAPPRDEPKTECLIEKSEEASPQPGPTHKQSPSPSASEARLLDDDEIIDLDDSENSASPTEAIAEEPGSTFSDRSTAPTADLIEETYCPICAVIMRNVTEAKVNLHINRCMDKEQRREQMKNSNTTCVKLTPKANKPKGGVRKRSSNTLKKKDSGSITKFFTK
ncbi:uncharacterized protein LOC100909084 [Galendromus occidentalis]|uniref:DNA polymerase kappa n=1 Tax=Galendromus occidentalis TaxID=34638 RepID=A0AAJ6VY95_9ACAR|nr:uncharacterized protein LOC100909084 [Galendromus occidentalis]